MVIAFIGPAGSGKTTLASQVAKHFNVPFCDGDDFYPLSVRKQIEPASPNKKNSLQLGLIYKPLLNKVKTILSQEPVCIITHSFKKRLFRYMFDNEFGKDMVWVFVKPNEELHLEKLFAREWNDPNRSIHVESELKSRLQNRTEKYWAEFENTDYTTVIEIQNNYDKQSIDRAILAVLPLIKR